MFWCHEEMFHHFKPVEGLNKKSSWYLGTTVTRGTVYISCGCYLKGKGDQQCKGM